MFLGNEGACAKLPKYNQGLPKRLIPEDILNGCVVLFKNESIGLLYCGIIATEIRFTISGVKRYEVF